MSIAARIECEDVQFAYRRGFRLGPVTFRLDEGITCLVGANGAGKSTLFTLLIGLQRPNSGSITLNPAASVGYLPQSPDLPGHATCEEFLHHVAWLQGVAARDRTDAVAKALETVDLRDKADSRIRSLSGGMRRRLGIAHALVHDPAVVLLDEPTVGLDPVQRLGVRSTLNAVARGRVVVISTHLVEDVRGLADRILLMADGRVAFDGDIATLEALADPSSEGDTPLEKAMTTLMLQGTA